MYSRVTQAQPDGGLMMPGGLVARIVAGGAGAVLPFPLVGYLDDGQQTELVFLDNAPTPLSERSPPPNIVFPAGTFSAGQKLAYYVAQTVFEADYLTATGIQIAADGSGRLVVIANQADPTKASFFASFALSSSTTFPFYLFSPTKTTRILRASLRWPGKLTTGAKAALIFARYTGDRTGGSSGFNFCRAMDTSDVQTAALWLHSGGPSGDLVDPTDGSDLNFYIPAADGAFTPFTHFDFLDPAQRKKPLIIPPGDGWSGMWSTAAGFGVPGAGYDNGAIFALEWTEE